jgi:hypothetical protein
MSRRVPIAALWLAIVGCYAVSGVASGSALADGPAPFVAYTVFVLAFATIGAAVAWLRPANPIGWILLGAGLAYAIGGLADSRLEAEGRDGPRLAAWLSTWVWMAGIAPVATFGLLLFPTGRLPSARWRPVAWLAAAGSALVVSGLALRPGQLTDHPASNPVGLGSPALMDTASGVGAVLLIAAALGAVLSLRARYRRAATVERAQLRWLLLAGVLVALGALAAIAVETAGGSSDASNAIVTLSLASVPVAMGVAILRHRLYDVDLVLNRTLVYGVLTATLAGAYLAAVLLLQLALSPATQDSGLAIAASTLAVAALFRPARARIQAAVDRRFYRRRYDAARTLEAFGGRLRDELDLEAVSAELRGAVRETVQPAHVSLWLRPVTMPGRPRGRLGP